MKRLGESKALRIKRNDMPSPDDLVYRRDDYLMAVMFSKSTAANYELALSVCRNATAYSEMVVGKHLMHAAVFGKSIEQAGRAVAVLQYMEGVKSFQVFVGGQLIPFVRYVKETLDCYIKAMMCNDPTAHCHRIVENPFSQQRERSAVIVVRLAAQKQEANANSRVERYLFPCSLLLEFWHFKFQLNHPAKPGDQIQAAGVKNYVGCCPLFSSSDFRLIGSFVTIDGKECMV